MSNEKWELEYKARIQEVLDHDDYRWTKNKSFESHGLHIWNADADGDEDFCQAINTGIHIEMVFYTRGHINVSNNPYYRSIKQEIYNNYMNVDNIFPDKNQFTNSSPGFGVVVKSLVHSTAWFGGTRDISIKDFVQLSRSIFKQLNHYSNAEQKINIIKF